MVAVLPQPKDVRKIKDWIESLDGNLLD
jgi:hypothetical protein